MQRYQRFISLCLFSCLLIAAVGFLLAEPASAFSLFPSEPLQADGSNDFRTYIVAFYNFALPATALVAVVLIMIGGIIWITSAGDQGRISKAKEFIINPIIGLVLLSGVYVVLGFINPNLVILQPVTPEPLGTPGACIISDTECRFVIDKDDCPSSNFVEGVQCKEARELESFEAARKALEETRNAQFACEKDDVGHTLECINLAIRRIKACADFCRGINDSCRPSAAFGNDIECNGDSYQCFCKYDPEE